VDPLPAATVAHAFTTIRKARVSAAVVQQIEQLVRDGVLRGGERLPSERELASRLGVSRPAVREALRLLEVMGYLRTEAGRGTFVCAPLPSAAARPLREQLDLLEDDTLFEQLMVVREAIEPAIAMLAARHATEEDVRTLRRAHAEVGRQVVAGDLAAFTRADLALHNAITEVARNRVFRHIIAGLQDLLLAMRQLSMVDLAAPRAREAQREHLAIIEAIARHDEAGAARAMLEHFAQQRRAYLAHASGRAHSQAERGSARITEVSSVALEAAAPPRRPRNSA